MARVLHVAALLCMAPAAAGTKLLLQALQRAPALSPEELRSRCPLFQEPGAALLTRGTSGQGKRGCCENGAVLFGCDTLDFGPGSQVTWTGSDPDIPRGSFGTVVRIEQSQGHQGLLAWVKFPRGEFPFRPAALRRAGPRPASPNGWSCSCSACATVQEHLDIVRYELQDIAGRGRGRLRVRADLDPRVPRPNGHFPAGQRYALFLYPEHDPQGAYTFEETLCARIECWRRRGYDVVMRSVGDFAAVRRVMASFPDKSVHHLTLGGHGSSRTLVFGKGHHGKLEAGHHSTGQLLTRLRKKLTLNASVTLDACSTAENVWLGSNLFETVAAKLPGRRVVAATTDLHDDMWRKHEDALCLAGDTVVFNERGVAKMALAKRGKPNCKEMGRRDIEETANAGGLCLSRCWPKGCSSVLDDWKKKGLVGGGLDVLVAHAPGEKDDRRSCSWGSKQVCQLVRRL